MRAVIQYLAIMSLVAVACLVAGCASCGTCRGSEPTPQSWRAVSKQAQADDEAPPPPAVARRGPHARPVAPAQADEFATPPVDGPDPNEPTDDEPESPPTPKVRKTKGKTRLLKETDGGLVIEQHGSGQIFLNSPGAQPAQTPAQAAVFAQAPLVAAAPVATPVIPGPFTDAQVFGIARRIGGGLYYAATGKCPPLKAKAAAVQTVAVPAVTTAYVQQTSYALVPQTTLAAVPVQTMVPAPVAAAPLQYVAPAATALPPLPAATAPAAPLASPQAAPRKSLFGLGR